MMSLLLCQEHVNLLIHAFLSLFYFFQHKDWGEEK